MLSSDQFRVEPQGPTPLQYHRYRGTGDIQRFGVVDPTDTEHSRIVTKGFKDF